MIRTAFSIASILIATTAVADSDPKYTDPNVILDDLMELAETCEGMSDGQTNEEIFGIMYTRMGDTCQFQNGELDDHVRDLLQDRKLDWAGVDGKDGLWVKLPELAD